MKLKLLRSIVLIFILGLMSGCANRPQTSERTQTQKRIQEQIGKVRTAGSSADTGLSEWEQPETPVVISSDRIVEAPELKVDLPEVKREFRGAWIASVANINWPSKKGLSTEQQKTEAIHIIDVLKENNFNAIILQVRPSADALYDSPYEPWSVFLTGTQGDSPQPYYDPLEFWIEEAHKRGMELHAWLNPYRAHHTNGGRVTAASMVNKMPKEIVRLSNGMYWFDPSLPETQNHVSKVVMDIVKRYDVDGIHFDDYFYPYASYNKGVDFPDQASWNAYKKAGGTLSKSDWRRENVNHFIQRIYTEIKAEKNWVKFGISPFGIWKPGYPNGVSGLSQYDELYADAKLWLNEGWIDYFTPQLYWPIDAPRQSFVSLLNWWQSENTYKRHLWPGLNTVEIKTHDRPGEIIRQIESTRRILPDDTGVVHWSMAGLNAAMLNSLKNGPYAEKALVPKSNWLYPIISGKPNLEISSYDTEIKANWTMDKQQEVRHWVLYLKYGDEWVSEILEPEVHFRFIQKNKNNKKLNLIAVKAVDRVGGESDYSAIKID